MSSVIFLIVKNTFKLQIASESYYYFFKKRDRSGSSEDGISRKIKGRREQWGPDSGHHCILARLVAASTAIGGGDGLLSMIVNYLMLLFLPNKHSRYVKFTLHI